MEVKGEFSVSKGNLGAQRKETEDPLSVSGRFR